MACKVLFLCAIAVALVNAEEFQGPVPSGHANFAENFQDPEAFSARWVKSQATKEGADSDIAKYDAEWSIEAPMENAIEGDVGLVLKDKAKHAAISAKLDEVFTFGDKPFVFQYELKQQEAMTCGGSYVKLLSKTDDLDLAQVTDKTPYTIMFGPDACGTQGKIHFIFRHKHPVTGKYEEKHADISTGIPHFHMKSSHLLTLVVRPDNTFTITVTSVGNTFVKSGNLLEDLTPPVNPPAEIDDPEDKRPEDWDDKEKIPDPEASKPEDWDEDAPSHIPDEDATMPSDWLVDEPEYVADPDSSMPDDWDSDEDGEYEPPQISNPKCTEVSGCGPWTRPTKVNPSYKGKWKAPMIDNPSYQGVWAPRKIPNPDFYEDKEPFAMTPIAAISLELWTMSPNQMFDNFILTDDEAVAEKYAHDSFDAKLSAEAPANPIHNVLTILLQSTEERPWLWAVYVIVCIVLPVVIIVACCLPGKKDPAAEQRAQAKKTDEVQPDDPQPAAQEEEAPKQETQEAEAVGAGDLETEDATPETTATSEASEPVDEERAATPASAESLDVPEAGEEESSVRRSPRRQTKKKARREN